MESQFVRTQLLFGEAALEKLHSSRVAVFGVGGVGGHVVEALARGGIGALDLIDHDTIALSNLNRQIVATHSTIGKLKVEVAKSRVLDINPNCQVQTYAEFYLPETAEKFDLSQYDYIVDAIDTVTAKLYLAVQAKEAGTPLISSMGTGNKIDPTRFCVADIFETSEDKLARVIRKECRKRGIDKLKVVYSDEKPLVPLNRGEVVQEEGKPRKDTPGSTSFVPSVAGLIIAGEVLKDLTVVERKELCH